MYKHYIYYIPHPLIFIKSILIHYTYSIKMIKNIYNKLYNYNNNIIT